MDSSTVFCLTGIIVGRLGVAGNQQDNIHFLLSESRTIPDATRPLDVKELIDRRIETLVAKVSWACISSIIFLTVR